MKLKDQNILFFTRTMGLGGTENVILQLCEIFNTKVNKIVVCSCGGVNTSRLDSMGIKHYTVPDITQKNPRVMSKVLNILNNIIKMEKITVIHSHHRMAAFYASFLSKHNIVKIATAHNTFTDKKIFTKTAYKGTNIIAVGERVKENLIDYFKIPSKNVTVIRNAVKHFEDGDFKIEPIIEVEKNKGKIIIGNVGRLSKQKGINYFIEAINLIKDRCPKAMFFIIGDGEDLDNLKKLVKDLGLNSRIIFLGYRSDVQNMMKQMDFVVLSSLWEGLPLTPIEAFSVGKTIIATSVDGTPEIVKNMENGLLCAPSDPQDLAEKIVELVNNIDLRKRLEKHANENYKKYFSFEILSSNYIKYYENI